MCLQHGSCECLAAWLEGRQRASAERASKESFCCAASLQDMVASKHQAGCIFSMFYVEVGQARDMGMGCWLAFHLH